MKQTRNCDFCKKEYQADNRNLKRGWGLCCSKSCAAKKREKVNSKKPTQVKINKPFYEDWHLFSDDAFNEKY